MASASILTTYLILSAALILLNPSSATNILYSGQSLNKDQSLTEGNYALIMQADCNLVLYRGNGVAVWASQTWNKGKDCSLAMQKDGNLVIYSNGKPLWASNTGKSPQGNYVLVLQPDLNLVIYGGAIWASGTNVLGTANVTISDNPVVVNSHNISVVADNKK